MEKIKNLVNEKYCILNALDLTNAIRVKAKRNQKLIGEFLVSKCVPRTWISDSYRTFRIWLDKNSNYHLAKEFNTNYAKYMRFNKSIAKRYCLLLGLDFNSFLATEDDFYNHYNPRVNDQSETVSNEHEDHLIEVWDHMDKAIDTISQINVELLKEVKCLRDDVAKMNKKLSDAK